MTKIDTNTVIFLIIFSCIIPILYSSSSNFLLYLIFTKVGAPKTLFFLIPIVIGCFVASLLFFVSYLFFKRKIGSIYDINIDLFKENWWTILASFSIFFFFSLVFPYLVFKYYLEKFIALTIFKNFFVMAKVGGIYPEVEEKIINEYFGKEFLYKFFPFFTLFNFSIILVFLLDEVGLDWKKILLIFLLTVISYPFFSFLTVSLLSTAFYPIILHFGLSINLSPFFYGFSLGLFILIIKWVLEKIEF